MQLHELKLTYRKYRKPRVGRGGKRGTTSGHGTKGQKSRSGRRIRPAERDYIQRLPKLRGVKNRAGLKPYIVNLGDLKKISSDAVTPKTLKEAGLIPNLRGSVKILSNGEINRPLTFKDVAVSTQAKAKIESAGGRIL